jgi:hypothetical protein
MADRAGFQPDRLLLVGGFGSSLYLRQRLEQEFGGAMGELLSPPFAYSAVVEGAVRFLQQPGAIIARVSELTYGVQVGVVGVGVGSGSVQRTARWAPLVLGTSCAGHLLCWPSGSAAPCVPCPAPCPAPCPPHTSPKHTHTPSPALRW